MAPTQCPAEILCNFRFIVPVEFVVLYSIFHRAADNILMQVHIAASVNSIFNLIIIAAYCVLGSKNSLCNTKYVCPFDRSVRNLQMSVGHKNHTHLCTSHNLSFSIICCSLFIYVFPLKESFVLLF